MRAQSSNKPSFVFNLIFSYFLKVQHSMFILSYDIKKQLSFKITALSEPKTGLEPVTYALRMRCSTN